MFTRLALATLMAAVLATPLDLEERQSSPPPSQISIVPGLACGLAQKVYLSVESFIENGYHLLNGDPVILHMRALYFAHYWYLPAGGQGQIKASWSVPPFKCLDAGSNPGNGVHLKMWDCYDVPQQQWKIHPDRIELVGYNLCLDVPDGNLNAGYVQTWQCYDGNPNQMFYTGTDTN